MEKHHQKHLKHRTTSRRRRDRTLGTGLACATLIATALLGTAAPAHADTLVSDPASLVNPFIGTTGGGNVFPGADAPSASAPAYRG